MEISNKFDTIEHSYIAEKLATWRNDLDRIHALAVEYAETADQTCLSELISSLEYIGLPDSPIQRELRYIEEKRAKFEEAK